MLGEDGAKARIPGFKGDWRPGLQDLKEERLGGQTLSPGGRED